jgi:hypothetical protein
MDKKLKKIKEFSTVMIDRKTKNRIKYISEITNISQAKLLSELFDALGHVYVNFSKATFSVDYSPVSNEVTIKVYGTKRKGALTFGTCHTEQELQNTIDKEIRKP